MNFVNFSKGTNYFAFCSFLMPGVISHFKKGAIYQNSKSHSLKIHFSLKQIKRKLFKTYHVKSSEINELKSRITHYR